MGEIQASSTTSTRPSRRLLIIEDDPFTRGLLADAFTHEGGTRMAGIGFPMSTIKNAFWHSSIKVTERYVNTPREGLRWAMGQVNATFFGTPANEHEHPRTETETQTAFGLLTFDQVMGTRPREGNRSRLRCAVSRHIYRLFRDMLIA